MNIRLGNLTMFQFEDRIGIKLNDEDKNWLQAHKQDNAQRIGKDEFHIFDMPFSIIVGSKIKNELVEILTKYNDIHTFDEELQIIESEE